MRRLKYLICRIAGYTSSINQIENKIFHTIARKFQNKCSKLFKLWHILMTSLIHNTPYSCCITMNERLAYTRTRGIPRAYTIVHSLSVKRLECFKYDDIDTTYLIEDLYFVLFLYLTNIEIVFFCILIKKRWHTPAYIMFCLCIKELKTTNRNDSFSLIIACKIFVTI